MKRIAKFHKVSYEQFLESCREDFSEDEIKEMYDGIKLPVRATSGSAGYDIFAPFDFTLAPCVVGDKKNVAAKVVNFAEQELLLACEAEIVFTQEENIGIVAENPAV